MRSTPHQHIFYDSTNPRNIPSGAYAAVAINGRYAWDEYDINRMSKVFRFVEVDDGGDLARHAAQARGIDIEPHCVWPPERAMPFLEARAKSHGDATAYCNRSTWPTVRELIAKARIEVLYWIATLDGTVNVPGAWAVQYRDTGAVDLSVLHGVDNFHRP